MIRKSGNRFSEKIMLKQRDEIMIRFNLIGSWSRDFFSSLLAVGIGEFTGLQVDSRLD